MGRARNRPQRPNHKGRVQKTPPFVMLPHRLLESAAYASLDLSARCLLQELVMLYKGSNNGSLYLSVRSAADRLGRSDDQAIVKAFGDLQDRGFITLAKDAHFAVKSAETSRARCWRLTWHSWPECPIKAHRVPTNEWERYAPAGPSPASKRADRRLRALARHRKAESSGYLPVVEITPTEIIMAHTDQRAVVKITPGNPQKPAVPPFPVVVESTAYIDTTMGSCSSAWWRSDVEARMLANLVALTKVAQNRLSVLAKAA